MTSQILGAQPPLAAFRLRFEVFEYCSLRGWTLQL